MIRQLPTRVSISVALASGALAAGVGTAALAGAFVASPAASRPADATPSGATARQASNGPNPYIVCVAYRQAWGICIGPPTN